MPGAESSISVTLDEERRAHSPNTPTGYHRKPSALLNPKPHTIALVAGTDSRISGECSSTRTSSLFPSSRVRTNAHLLATQQCYLFVSTKRTRISLSSMVFWNPLHIASVSCRPCQQHVDLLPCIKKLSLGKFIPAWPPSLLLMSNRNKYNSQDNISVLQNSCRRSNKRKELLSWCNHILQEIVPKQETLTCKPFPLKDSLLPGMVQYGKDEVSYLFNQPRS